MGGDSVITGGRYNPALDSWASTSTISAPADRTNHSAIWTGTEMIIWGGDDFGTFYNDGGRYDPISDSWIPTGMMNTPEGRDSHTTIWTGSEMIIWGGISNYLGYLNTGGMYAPSTDSWTSTYITNAPIARGAHAAVWTGTEMILWGGGTDQGLLDSGGRYNPATNQWSSTNTFNAPAQRNHHTAIWTGTEMIVWGGHGASQLINTGGKYDPLTDSWMPTSTTNAPVARQDHSVIWTGTEMIVWGGSNGGFLKTGGRYDPTTDNWISTTTLNAPDARQEHSAVWTGSEMIVWGGLAGINAKTGGKYNPDTDSWIPTSTIGAPSGRADHTAIWTGSEMIVWGGHNIPSTPGGRYRPAQDVWQLVDTLNEPTARDMHTAVWTGTEMIVWGGYPRVNTGGAYCALSHAPVAANDSYVATEDVTLSVPMEEGVLVNDVDPDDDPLTAILETQPSFGLLTLNNDGSFTYLPDPNFNGNDSFTYHATDGTYQSNSANVSIMVSAVNDSPVASDDFATTPQDNAVVIDVLQNDSDVDGDILTIFSVNQPSNGTAVDNGDGTITYTPDSGFFGTDTFSYTITDGHNEFSSAQVEITVTQTCLYCDDFNDGVQPNWTEIKPDCNESGGFMNCTPVRKKAIIIATPAFSGCQNCSVETSVLMTGDTGGRIWLLTHYIDKKNTLEILMKEENDKVVVKQRSNGSIIAKAKADITLDPNNLYSVKVQYDGNIVTVNIGSAPTPQITFTPIGTLQAGTIGFQSKNTNGMFDYITVN